MASSMYDAQEWQAALCRFKNCLWLLEDQSLRRMVGLKVFRQEDSVAGNSHYLIIIHVRADYIFSQYFETASQADLPLFRGMFMTLDVRGDFAQTKTKPLITNCEVHQAFLPKFENEGQDAEIASAILAGAGQRYMVVTVKHSGSLATLSYDLMGAKNSQGNIYTAVAVLLLKAHYQRVATSAALDADTLLNGLFSAMKSERLSVSFETVARCLSHHGQLPEGEYIVVTSVTRLNLDGSVEVLPLFEHLKFCSTHHLPVNDAWLFCSRSAAIAGDSALDDIAKTALPTSAALACLDSVAARNPSDVIRIHGTYPHSLWQGTRVEGFVISQGAPVDPHSCKHLQELATALRSRTLALSLDQGVGPAVAVNGAVIHQGDARFAERVLYASGVPRGADRGSGDLKGTVAAAVDEAAPELKFLMGRWVSAADKEHHKLLDLVHAQSLPLQDAACMRLPRGGGLLPSRHAVATANENQRRKLAGSNLDLKRHLGLEGAEGADGAASQARGRPRGQFSAFDINAAMKDMAGPLLRSRGLRYKKKMWSFRTPADALPPALAPLLPASDSCAASSTGSTSAPEVPTSTANAPESMAAHEGRAGGGALAAPVQEGTVAVGAHVAYCMMTFIIRNGIKHLRDGPAAYDGYVNSLVRRWGLQPEQRKRVQEFAKSWAGWAAAQGYATTIRDSLYLDIAEEFVEHFLSRRSSTGAPPHAAASGSRGRPGGLRRTGSSSSGPWSHCDLSGNLSRTASVDGSAGGRRGGQHRRGKGGGLDSRSGSGNITSDDTSGSVHGQRKRCDVGRDAGRDSKSCSDTSLTALAGHCPLPARGKFRGLALLVGFSDSEAQDIAVQVGADGCGQITRDADVEKGWVATLAQVPHPAEKQFWKQAIPLLKFVRRLEANKTASAQHPEPSSSIICTISMQSAGNISQSETWALLSSLSSTLPCSLIQEHLEQGVAMHGPEWLQTRWLDVQAAPSLSATGSAPMSSDGSLLSQGGSHLGEASKWKLNKGWKQPGEKRASWSYKDVISGGSQAREVAASGAQDSLVADSAAAPAYDRAVMAQVVAWLGHGIPRVDTVAQSAAGHHTPAGIHPHAADAGNDPALVVVFISTPGLGKTSICEALMTRLDPAKYHAVHHHSDAQSLPERKRFWPTVNSLAHTQRGDGRTTVILADKNLLDNPRGNWDKTAATINVPVLAVLLSDSATAAKLNPAPAVDAPAPPTTRAPSAIAGAQPPAVAAPDSTPSAGGGAPARKAPPQSAAASAAAAAVAKEAFGLLRVHSGDSADMRSALEAACGTPPSATPPCAPAPSSPGVAAPFSMEQLALAMMRVVRREDHIGQLDQRQEDCLRIMCGFAGCFRKQSAASAVRRLKSAFPHVHVLPVCTAQSSAPAPPPDTHGRVMRAVCTGFKKGRFGKGQHRYGVHDDWEPRLRRLLADPAVAAFLEGFARPLDCILDDLQAAMERALAGAAAPGAPAAAAAAPTSHAAQRSTDVNTRAQKPGPAMAPQAAQEKLHRCEYVAVGGFSRSAVADAFAKVQRTAAGNGRRAGATHSAKDELHITLWHRAEGPAARGLACVAAEGEPMDFLVTGFDVAPSLSAARVEFPEQPRVPGSLVDAGVLDVKWPHITMHVGPGQKAVDARRLRQRQESGDAAVEWLPLPEPLRLTGKVHVVSRRW